MIDYGFTKELDISFDETVTKVTEALRREGSCNPTFAHKAIVAEENIGLMLPCNILVYEKDRKTVLGVIKPSVAMKMVPNPELERNAQTVEAKLKSVFDSV
jgi:uncharacterized protein (DUF302 family)